MSDPKHIADAVSLTTVVATVAGWLPHVAAVLSIIWTLIRIYETRTVQRALGIDKPPPFPKLHEGD